MSTVSIAIPDDVQQQFVISKWDQPISDSTKPVFVCVLGWCLNSGEKLGSVMKHLLDSLSGDREE